MHFTFAQERTVKLSIVPKYSANVTQAQIDTARALAANIRNEQPILNESEQEFRHLIVDSPIDDSPALHLDDFSEIPLIGTSDSSDYLQQRARLRAGDGDFVAFSRKVEGGYSDYCEHKLGLGQVNWIYPSDALSSTRDLAFVCLRDRRVRNELVQAIRHHGLRYIHPHISTMSVWQLANSLHNSARLPIRVIGPTPALSAWANNKIDFTAAAERLLGPTAVPTTEAANNFAMLSKTIVQFAETHSRMGIKFPYGVGGTGNFLVDASQVRGLTLGATHDYLKRLLAGHRWPDSGRVLVDVWESNVINSPSVQTWIPPASVGQPIIEGLFRQSVHGETGAFVGSCPVNLPPELEQEISDSSYLLTVLFQELGYVGRCSFDLILIGESIENCRFEFVECNARWGGTSIPMTLVNRLNIGSDKTFSVQKANVPGLEKTTFPMMVRELGSELYDSASGNGRFVLFNPARIKSHSGIEAIAIANTTQQAEELLSDVLTPRLAEMVDAVEQNSNATGPHFDSTKETESFSQD